MGSGFLSPARRCAGPQHLVSPPTRPLAPPRELRPSSRQVCCAGAFAVLGRRWRCSTADRPPSADWLSAKGRGSLDCQGRVAPATRSPLRHRLSTAIADPSPRRRDSFQLQNDLAADCRSPQPTRRHARSRHEGAAISLTAPTPARETKPRDLDALESVAVGLLAPGEHELPTIGRSDEGHLAACMGAQVGPIVPRPPHC